VNETATFLSFYEMGTIREYTFSCADLLNTARWVLSARTAQARSRLQRTELLVDWKQGRLQVKDGNPASPVPVNGSFTAQLHKLSKRFKRRGPRIESAALT